MRSDVQSTPPTYSCGASSPPAADVWSTQRRLDEKLPPGAPQRRRPHPGSDESIRSSFNLSKKHRVDRLLLPSRTINDDDDDSECSSPFVSLSFRPTRLLFNDASFGGFTTRDPTTVLLVPDERFQWGDDEDDDDDFALSPRLFRFGQTNVSNFAEVGVAESDESEFIFRGDNLEGRDSTDDEDSSLLSCATTMKRSNDDERV